MRFTVASSLLDACVLAVLSNIPTYGYDLTQKIGITLSVSESTLYPVLRRLLKDGLLESYDEPYDGRNRRYYMITDKGKCELLYYREEWQTYKVNIESLLLGGVNNDQG